VLDLTRSAWSRISFDPAVEHWPVWSPDGTRLVYESHRNNALALYEKLVDSSMPDHLVVDLNRENGACAWSPSGREILYWAFDPKTKADVWIIPVKGDRKPVPLVQSPFNEYCGDFSPDEHFLAYASDETGRPEVFVQALSRGPDGILRASGGRWQISTSGGMQPRWRRDGKEIFFFGDFQSGKGKMMSAPVTRGASGLETGASVVLFNWGTPNYVVSPDGRRFLMAIRPGASPAAAVSHRHQGSTETDQRGPDPADSAATVILNLFAGMKR
jgi:Tol biopolymer transport system component